MKGGISFSNCTVVKPGDPGTVATPLDIIYLDDLDDTIEQGVGEFTIKTTETDERAFRFRCSSGALVIIWIQAISEWNAYITSKREWLAHEYATDAEFEEWRWNFGAMSNSKDQDDEDGDDDGDIPKVDREKQRKDIMTYSSEKRFAREAPTSSSSHTTPRRSPRASLGTSPKKVSPRPSKNQNQQQQRESKEKEEKDDEDSELSSLTESNLEELNRNLQDEGKESITQGRALMDTPFTSSSEDPEMIV